MTDGESPPSITAFIAADTAGPGNLPARSPVAYTLVAPYSPSAPATADASPPMNAETFEESERAFVSSSRVPVVGAPPAVCANTQMLLIAMTFYLRSLSGFQGMKQFC